MSLKTTERRQYTDTNVSRIIAFSLLYIDSRLRYIIYVLTALAPRLPDSHVSATARTSACPRTATGRTAAAWSASRHLLFSSPPTSLMNEAARIAIACDVDRSNRSRMRIPSVRFLSSRLTFAVFSASASGQGTRRSRSPFSWSSRSKRPPSEKPSA